MKKFLTILLVAAFAVSLLGCNFQKCGEATSESSAESVSSVDTETEESVASESETAVSSEEATSTDVATSEDETVTTHSEMEVIVDTQPESSTEVEVTERETDGHETLISVLHITVTNGEPVKASTEEEHYTIQVSTDSNETTIVITAEEGYRFAEGVKLFVNGTDRSAKAAISDDSCTITYKMQAWSPIV